MVYLKKEEYYEEYSAYLIRKGLISWDTTDHCILKATKQGGELPSKDDDIAEGCMDLLYLEH